MQSFSNEYSTFTLMDRAIQCGYWYICITFVQLLTYYIQFVYLLYLMLFKFCLYLLPILFRFYYFLFINLNLKQVTYCAYIMRIRKNIDTQLLHGYLTHLNPAIHISTRLVLDTHVSNSVKINFRFNLLLNFLSFVFFLIFLFMCIVQVVSGQLAETWVTKISTIGTYQITL